MSNSCVLLLSLACLIGASYAAPLQNSFPFNFNAFNFSTPNKNIEGLSMQNVSLISGGCNTPGGACGIKADSISGGVINGKRSTEDIEKRNYAHVEVGQYNGGLIIGKRSTENRDKRLDYAIVHGTDFTGSTFEGKRSTEGKNKRWGNYAFVEITGKRSTENIEKRLNFAEVTGQSFNGVKFEGKRSTENIEKRFNYAHVEVGQYNGGRINGKRALKVVNVNGQHFVKFSSGKNYQF